MHYIICSDVLPCFNCYQAVSELQTAGILTVDWLAGEKGNLLKRVILNLDKLDAAYLLAERIPKADQLTTSAQMLATTLASVHTPSFTAGLRCRHRLTPGIPCKNNINPSR
jgi:hypothetical protein